MSQTRAEPSRAEPEKKHATAMITASACMAAVVDDADWFAKRLLEIISTHPLTQSSAHSGCARSARRWESIEIAPISVADQWFVSNDRARRQVRSGLNFRFVTTRNHQFDVCSADIDHQDCLSLLLVSAIEVSEQCFRPLRVRFACFSARRRERSRNCNWACSRGSFPRFESPVSSRRVQFTRFYR